MHPETDSPRDDHDWHYGACRSCGVRFADWTGYNCPDSPEGKAAAAYGAAVDAVLELAREWRLARGAARFASLDAELVAAVDELMVADLEFELASPTDAA